MSNTNQMIEVNLQVTASDESTAARVAEVMSRLLVSLSTENVYASIHIDRYAPSCSHDHDEVGQ